MSVVWIPVGSDPLLRPCSLAGFVRGIWGRSGRSGKLRSWAFLAHQAKPFLIFHACSDIRFSLKIKFGELLGQTAITLLIHVCHLELGNESYHKPNIRNVNTRKNPLRGRKPTLVGMGMKKKLYFFSRNLNKWK